MAAVAMQRQQRAGARSVRVRRAAGAPGSTASRSSPGDARDAEAEVEEGSPLEGLVGRHGTLFSPFGRSSRL